MFGYLEITHSKIPRQNSVNRQRGGTLKPIIAVEVALPLPRHPAEFA